MFAFYLCSPQEPIVQTSYHKGGKHVAFYFHELVQHKLFFMNLFYIKHHLYVTSMFAFYVSLSGPIVQKSYHKAGRHVAIYFHEHVHHKLSFMNLFYIKLHLYVCLLSKSW